MATEIPHAQFRFNGEVISMTEAQFGLAIRDARICGCGQCLACRALEYGQENAKPAPNVPYVDTCIEHGPGGTLRLPFQIRVF